MTERASRDRSADEPEIEVTPEMVEAGMDEYYGGCLYEDAPRSAQRDTIVEIYRAMVRAKPRAASSV